MKKYWAQVTVNKKPTVADPEGKTIAEALSRLGYNNVGRVRSGKVFSLNFEADCDDSARDYLNEIALNILSNPVIEIFEMEFKEIL